MPRPPRRRTPTAPRLAARRAAGPAPTGFSAPVATARRLLRGPGPEVAVALVVFVLALWQNLSDVALTPFHPDETRWLNRAHYLQDLADPFGPTWDDGYLTRGQPPLGSYLMGLGLTLQGRDLATNGVWDFNQEPWWNVAHGNMAHPADLRAGRRTSAVVGALTALAVYALARRLAGRVGGATAALFLAAHPLLIHVSSQAVSDSLLALLVALAALAAARLADRPTWPRALLLGALLGLGGAAKLSPLLLALPLAAVGAGLLLAARRRAPADPPDAEAARRARLGVRLLAVPLVAFAVFVAAYPYLWSDPIGRTANLFAFRTGEMEYQGSRFPGVAVESRAEAFRRVGITLGDRFSTTGRLAAKLAHGLGRPWHPAGADLPLALAGGLLLTVGTLRRGLGSAPALAAAVLGGQAALIVLGMRSDWPRYHVPVLLLVAVAVGVLADRLWVAAARGPARARLLDAAYGLLDRAMPDGVPPAGPPRRPGGVAAPAGGGSGRSWPARPTSVPVRPPRPPARRRRALPPAGTGASPRSASGLAEPRPG